MQTNLVWYNKTINDDALKTFDVEISELFETNESGKFDFLNNFLNFRENTY